MKLISGVHNLEIPLILLKNEHFKSILLFEGITGGLLQISCNVSALVKKHRPHDLHNHQEEELLLLFSGSGRLIHQNIVGSAESRDIDLKEGQFVYYPADFPHTIETTSDMPANFLTIKWRSSLKKNKSGLNFSHFCIPEKWEDKKNEKFLIKTLFDKKTQYLKKLHCHTSIIKPGGRFRTHRDIYDVITIILEGEVETLGEKVKPYDVVFNAINEPHGIYNPGDKKAREVVFEFHSSEVSLNIKIPYLINYYFHKLLRFSKRKVKKILGFICKFK